RLPGDDGADGRRHFVAFGAADHLGIAAAAGGDVDHGDRLLVFGRGVGGDLFPIRGEDAVRLGVVGQVGEHPAFAAEPLHPEAALAAEQQRATARGGVLDVGGAGAGDQLAQVGAVLADRVNVGVGARTLGALAAAEDDRLVEVAGRELVQS